MEQGVEKTGAAMKLTRSLDDSSYGELRAEFLEMTAEAQKSSGLTRAKIVERCAPAPGRQTVYNYAGSPKYTSFPEPDLLETYLTNCGLAQEQVRFAVTRCEEIRRRFPEAGKSSPRPKRPRSIEGPSPIDGASDRWWVGTVLRNSGVRVSPGRTALRVASEELGNSHPEGGYRAAALVRMAYRASGVDLPTLASEQAESGVAVPFEHAEPGDIVVLTDGRGCLYVADGKALLVASPWAADLWPVPRDQIRSTRRLNWLSVPLSARPIAKDERAELEYSPAPPVDADVEPPSTRELAEKFEQMMAETSAKIAAYGRAAEPGLAALRAVDALAFPYEGSQTWLVREAFKAADLPLSPYIRFELPMMAVAAKHVDLRAGDIVFTDAGILGIYDGNGELVYLGAAGKPAVSALQSDTYVVTWRVTAVPAADGYRLVSQVKTVEHDGKGRLERIYRPGERPGARHQRLPETPDIVRTPATAEVVAMVCEVLEEVGGRGVIVCPDGPTIGRAAVRNGVAFVPWTMAWDPLRHPVHPRDARMRSVQPVPTGTAPSAAQLMKSRLATAPAAQWSARKRAGAA